MTESVEIQCPWCFETQWLWLAIDDLGEMIQDCEVCCRPWRLFVSRDHEGHLHASVDRA